MGQDDDSATAPLTGLEQVRDRVRAGQIQDLERRKAALLARRDIIDRDVRELEARLRKLRQGTDPHD